MKKNLTKINDKNAFVEFFKKNYRIEKGKQIICIFNYFSKNSTLYEERFVHIEALEFLLHKK